MVKVLRNLPHETGAEIGVHRGLFASKILAELPEIKTYYCIDSWEFYEDYKKTLRKGSFEATTSKDKIKQAFLNKIAPWKNKCVILHCTSMEALSSVPDEGLDWVFIDANHAYKYAKQDITGWSKKVKVGGLIAGHDFTNKHQHKREIPFGVDRAVKELIPQFEVIGNVWYTIKTKDLL